MAKKTETNNYKKVSVLQIKLSDKPAGFEIEGKFIGCNQQDFTDRTTGESKPMYSMIIENEKKERIKFLADAGLRTAIADGMIQPGDWFKAVKGVKADIGKGRTMNQWDVYAVSEELP